MEFCFALLERGEIDRNLSGWFKDKVLCLLPEVIKRKDF